MVAEAAVHGVSGIGGGATDPADVLILIHPLIPFSDCDVLFLTPCECSPGFRRIYLSMPLRNSGTD